jgi:hypothetical protein
VLGFIDRNMVCLSLTPYVFKKNRLTNFICYVCDNQLDTLFILSSLN